MPKTFASIGGPRGHATFTLEGAKFRCSCGALLSDRSQHAAHLRLYTMLAPTAVRA